ncbi:atlastin-3-like isoform X2 [Clavelina lepadiformis]|uniref:atlastin-3-like isoform X2 n=1 Tax=Clavelina lepadiformis TaxID=159417 RepID=UPI0040435778
MEASNKATDYLPNLGGELLQQIPLAGNPINKKHACWQILKPVSDGFELNEEALFHVFCHPDVIDNPVMIISVAGAMREGKSFLLNLFLMYLESGMSKDWLSDEEKVIPQKFEWKAGVERTTLGVYLWNKPYFITSAGGTKITVLLMDTQGAFDRDGKRVSNDIFAFSTLLSSVQIYNIHHHINENHLQPLSVFSLYAAEKSKLSGRKLDVAPFQKLLFVVRDWQANNPKFSFGIKGGKKYVTENILAVKPGDKKDVIVVRKGIQSAFQNIDCCLLPYPGDCVAGNSEDVDETSVQVKDMPPSFRQVIAELVSHLFHPKSGVIKTFNGEEIKGKDFINLASKLCEVLNDKTLSQPHAAIQAEITVKAQNVCASLLREYHIQMEKNLKTYISTKQLKSLHDAAKRVVLGKFQKKLAAEDKAIVDLYNQQLDEELENSFPSYWQKCHMIQRKIRKNFTKVQQEAFNAYKANIDKGASKSESQTLAVSYLLANVPKVEQLCKEYQDKLIKQITNLSAPRKTLMGMFKDIAEDCVTTYKNDMRLLKSSINAEDDLTELHLTYKRRALDNFKEKSKQNIKTSDIIIMKTPIDEQEIELASAIDQEFAIIKNKKPDSDNCSIPDTDNDNADHELMIHCAVLKTIYNSYMSKMKEGRSDLKLEDSILLSKDISIVEEEYSVFAAKMQQRKGLYRASTYGAKLYSNLLLKFFVSIPGIHDDK